MENKENPVDKVRETLTKELESLSNEGLHEFFMFVYRLNHAQNNMIDNELFEEFLEGFDSNPFKVNEDKAFRKQLIENLIKYTYDHMSLLTAVLLLKKKFTIEEVINNYYSSVDAFGYDVF